MSNVTAKPKPSFFQIAMPVGVLLLSGLSVAYWARGGAQVTPPPTLPADTAQAETAAPAPEGLSDRLAHLGARGAALSNGDRAVTDDLPASLAQLHASMNNAQAKRGDRDRIVAELESNHKAEPIDAAWSSQSEVNILSATTTKVMTQAGFKPQDVATDCRSKTCRISARFADSGDAEDWGDRLVTQMGPTLSQVKTTVIKLPDGSSEIRMYGARKMASNSQQGSRSRI
jgi:hypothetical protein